MRQLILILAALCIINLASAADNIDVDPNQRFIQFDFDSMYSQGDAYNLALNNGQLELAQTSPGIYSSTGYWISPSFDTQQEYNLWEWVSGDADFNGMQENLVHDGDFEPPFCTQNMWGTNYDKPCGYYFNNLDPPFVDSRYSTSGQYSARFEFNDSRHHASGYMNLASNSNPELSNWFEIDPHKNLHAVFDFKQHNPDSGLEMWYTLSLEPTWGNNYYNGQITRFEGTFEDFVEKYIIINASQFMESDEDYRDIRYVNFWLFEYYTDDEVQNVAWIDDLRIFQDSPISFQTRSSEDGITWTDWSEPRFFVAEKTDPGSPSGRYIQFKINMNSADKSKTPRLSQMRLDYSKAFPFKIPWYYEGPAIFDQEVKTVDQTGFVSVTADGNLEFEDGSPAKFWAVQNNGLDEAWADWTEEDSIAMCKRLRQMGFNMIKSDMDNDYNAGRWDQWDRMLYACRQEGIYFYVQLNGPSNCANSVEKILPHQRSCFEQHISGFMNHVNPYTGLAYKDDPQIAMVQLLNERRLHQRWATQAIELHKDGYLGSGYGYYGYYTEMKENWEAWMTNKYPTFAQLQESWESSPGQAFTDEELAGAADYPHNVYLSNFSTYNVNEWTYMSEQRFRDHTEFIADLYSDFYQDMSNYIRNDMGSDALIIANNHFYGLSEMEARLVTDIIDQHSYYGHPREPSGWGEIMSNVPQSMSPSNNMFTYIGLNSIKNYPLSVSESNQHFPDLYNIEMPFFVSAMMSFHDYDQWTYFKFVPASWITNDAQVPEPLDSMHDSGRLALMPAASMMFREGYIAPGEEIIDITHSRDTTLDFQYSRQYRNYAVPGLTQNIVMTQRVARADFNGVDHPYEYYETRYNLQPLRSPYVTDTGQIITDSNKGQFIFDAPKAQGFTGNTPENTLTLGDINIKIYPKGNNFSALAIVPLDDQDIADSTHLFLSAAGRTQAHDIIWTADKRGYLDFRGHWWLSHYGHEPVLIEGINADITLKINSDSVTAYPLNTMGQRSGPKIQGQQSMNGILIPIRDTDETLWYEIVVGESSQAVFGDLTGDDVVDVQDLLFIFQQYGEQVTNDLDGDHDLDLKDLALFGRIWVG